MGALVVEGRVGRHQADASLSRFHTFWAPSHFRRGQHLLAEWDKECEGVPASRQHWGYHPGEVQTGTRLLDGGEGVRGDRLVCKLEREKGLTLV